LMCEDNPAEEAGLFLGYECLSDVKSVD
jgi:hypothetical protein